MDVLYKCQVVTIFHSKLSHVLFGKIYKIDKLSKTSPTLGCHGGVFLLLFYYFAMNKESMNFWFK